MACFVLEQLLLLVGPKLTHEARRTIYPELLKRLDDSSNQVRGRTEGRACVGVRGSRCGCVAGCMCMCVCTCAYAAPVIGVRSALVSPFPAPPPPCSAHGCMPGTPLLRHHMAVVLISES